MQNDYGKRIVLPCHKHVRCDNVIFSFKCYYPNCSDMSSASFERFGFFFPSRFVQQNSFKPAHLLIASYPLEWQSTPGCQPLRPNPLDCVRLHIRALWTRAPTVFQCCNVVQVPSKSKTLPDAGVLWALPPQPHWMKCSVLEPWFTRRACDHRHSCINLWPRCSLKQKPASACAFPRFPLYCMPAEAVPLVSGHYEKKDRLRRREGWNCRQSHRRDAFHCLMTLCVLRWEENSFEITNTSTSLSFAERNYFVCTPSQATAIGCVYIYLEVKHLFWTNSFAQRECWDRAVERYLLTALTQEKTSCVLKSGLLWQQQNNKVAWPAASVKTPLFSLLNDKYGVSIMKVGASCWTTLDVGFYQRECLKMRLSPTSMWQS